MTATAHTESLVKRAQTILDTAQAKFSKLSEEQLNWKADAESWSILECLEHLNRYSKFYHSEIENAIAKFAGSNAPAEVKYSWFGKKSIDVVDPNNVKPQKTIKRMNPQNSQLTKQTLEQFLSYQKDSRKLIQRISQIDFNKKAIRVEFFKLIKLRIGEAMEFMVSHEERHLAQACRVLDARKSVSAA